MNQTGLRLLFLADAVFDDLPGGSRVVARELAKGLALRGHEVTFLVARQSPDPPDDERLADGTRVVRYGGLGHATKFIHQGQAACARLWAEQPFDLVHAHFAYAALGPLRATPRAVPRLRTFHGPWDEEAWLMEMFAGRLNNTTQAWGKHRLSAYAKALVKRRLRYLIEERNLLGSTRVLTLSESFRRIVIERYHVPPEKVVVIPGGADLCRFQPSFDQPACRQELGLPADRRILLSVRRLEARMGLDNLIQAMPNLVRRFPDLLLLIGGSGSEHGHLDSLIRSLQLESHVRLLGFVHEKKLPVYYQAADLFVLPTLALEGFGLVTAEALACGLPVVGTPLGGTLEILQGLDSRLVASGTSAAALGEAITGFLEDEWSALLTRERLHRYVAEHYAWDKHIAATEAVYHSLLKKAPSVL